MGQRSPSALPTRPEAHVWEDFIKCEVERDEHEVRPTTWPPPRIGMQAGDPYVTLPCIHCGATCVTYPGHATGQMRGIRVLLPEAVKK